MKKVLVIIITFLNNTVWAQQAQVRSHYPQTAFVTGRLLPFQLVQGVGLSVVEVETLGGPGCFGFSDPFLEDHFHLYCEKKSGSVSLKVHYQNKSGQQYSIKTQSFQILSIDEATPSAGGQQ